ncbi:hypothetical protein KORDIASMS9_03399 [Kordia sp. SMS9]|uniref:hypothetical protein n=1 Tax=Kordia sp. SMS9 TaxID=2282170 RepID=UPI000E0CCB7A|nr:hypothetical protein [Kordia sp. SMS9]AXG71144.1 hypothetical protein KORDIASMS9_03399 [Kordia sp. SMS9]
MNKRFKQSLSIIFIFLSAISVNAQNCGSENLSKTNTQNPTLRNMGQSFTLCSNELVKSISIKRRNSPGTSNDREGTLWIYEGSGVGKTELHKQAIKMDAFTDEDAKNGITEKMVTFTLDKALYCKKGQTYTFYFELKMVKDNALILILGNAQDPYKGGDAFYEKNAKRGSDFWFQLGINCGSENLSKTNTQNPTLRNMGQSFTLCSNELVKSISIKRRNSPGTSNDREGTLWIYEGSGVGKTELHKQAIKMDAFTDEDAKNGITEKVVTFTLDKALHCKKGQTYTFYFELKMVKDNALILILGNAQNPYKGGDAFYEKNAKRGSDFWFQLEI